MQNLYFCRSRIPKFYEIITSAPIYTIYNDSMQLEWNLYFRRSHIPKFYEITKNGTDGCLYYGFATCGNKVFDSFSFGTKEGKHVLS